MAKATRGNMIGSWAFLIGVILAIVLGFIGNVGNDTVWTTVLVVIGIVVGLLNIADEEASPFMMSGIVLILASAFGQGILAQSIPAASEILAALLIIFVPATIIVAIKNVFVLARR